MLKIKKVLLAVNKLKYDKLKLKLVATPPPLSVFVEIKTFV